MSKIIGLLAPKQSGKTSLANGVKAIASEEVFILSFAKTIKDDLRHKFNIHPGSPESRYPVRFGAFLAVNYRESCQFYGDLIRGIDDVCLLRSLSKQIDHAMFNGAGIIIVDDVRLEQEVEFLESYPMSRVVLISRPGMVQSDVHTTERFARKALTRKGEWTVFTNEKPMDLSARALYELIRSF